MAESTTSTFIQHQPDLEDNLSAIDSDAVNASSDVDEEGDEQIPEAPVGTTAAVQVAQPIQVPVVVPQAQPVPVQPAVAATPAVAAAPVPAAAEKKPKKKKEMTPEQREANKQHLAKIRKL